MWNSQLSDSQAGIKISGRNINRLNCVDDTTLMAENEEEVKEPLDEGERGEWKSWLKLNVQKNKIMAFSHISLWQINGEKMERVTDCIFLGSKAQWVVTATMKLRHFIIGSKPLTNLDSILRSKDNTLLTKVKAIFFPIVKCRCENWTIKKAEHQKIDSFALWCWRRLLRVPWTARKSNQSILN